MTAPVSRRAFTAINVVGTVVLVLGVCRVFGQPWLVHLGPTKYWGPPVDLQIYRYGGQFLLHGRHLYDGPMPQANDSILPFTYPPFAAVSFVPMSWMPVRLLSVIFLILGCLLTWWLIRVLLRRVGCADLPAGWSMILTGVAFELEPIRITLDLGQINLILAGLVIADTLWDRRPAWAEPYRGLLVGIAAAIKMTPAVVVIYFFARRQWRAAINVVVGFLAATGIAWAITPSDTWKYWTSTVFDPERIGGLAFVYNQGIAGVLARTGMSDSDRSHWWLPLCAVAGLYCLALAWHLAKRCEYEMCFLAAWAVALLATPAAWIHHWVLTSVYVLVFVTIGARALRARRGDRRGAVFLGLGILGLIAQLPGPSLSLPSAQLNELRWGWWEIIYGNSSLIWLVLILLISWWLPLTRVREAWEPGADQPGSVEPGSVEPEPVEPGHAESVVGGADAGASTTATRASRGLTPCATPPQRGRRHRNGQGVPPTRVSTKEPRPLSFGPFHRLVSSPEGKLPVGRFLSRPRCGCSVHVCGGLLLRLSDTVTSTTHVTEGWTLAPAGAHWGQRTSGGNCGC